MNNLIEKQNQLRATEGKMESMKVNKVWELVKPPLGKKVIECNKTFKA